METGLVLDVPGVCVFCGNCKDRLDQVCGDLLVHRDCTEQALLSDNGLRAGVARRAAEALRIDWATFLTEHYLWRASHSETRETVIKHPKRGVEMEIASSPFGYWFGKARVYYGSGEAKRWLRLWLT